MCMEHNKLNYKIYHQNLNEDITQIINNINGINKCEEVCTIESETIELYMTRVYVYIESTSVDVEEIDETIRSSFDEVWFDY